MIIEALFVSDDLRDFCDDQQLPCPANVDEWLKKHETRIREAMEYAAMSEIREILEQR